MSLPESKRSGTDLSSSSSWSVIEESGSSCKSSLHDILEEVDVDTQKDAEVEKTFVTVPERGTTSGENQQRTTRKSKRRKTSKFYAEPLSIATIIASILTITGITLLCALFPQDIDTESYNQLQKVYTEAINANSNVPEVINKTAEAINIIQDADVLRNVHKKMEHDEAGFNDVCPAEDSCDDCKEDDETYEGPRPFEGMRQPFRVLLEEKITDKPLDTSIPSALSNTSLALLNQVKETLLVNPQFLVLLCTVLQDICLIRLIKQLNNKHVALFEKVESNLNSTLGKKETKRNVTLTKNVKPKMTVKMKGSTKTAAVPRYTKTLLEKDNSSKKIATETGNQSSCVKKFQELQHKWESAGQSHRQKIQEIKANFKSEVLLARKNEKELPLRTQKIKLIRDKYVSRLKADRERYLSQLKKLKEERQKLLKDVCHKKTANLDLKDASVGNNVFLLHGYDFHEKLRSMRSQEGTSSSTSSHSNISLIKEMIKEAKRHSLDNIPTNSSSTKITINTSRQSFTEDNDEKSRMELFNKIFPENNIQRARGLSQYPSVEEIVSSMISSLSTTNTSFSNTTKEDERNKSREKHPDRGDMSGEEAEPQFKVVIRRKAKKRDIYDAVFDKEAKRIKEVDMLKWNPAKRVKSPSSSLHSKQDPSRIYKQKIVFKGQL